MDIINMFDDEDLQCVNLDAMTEKELVEFWKKNKEGTVEQRAAATYAVNKAMAMRMRTKGAIESALKLEAHCDWIYDKLPEKMQW